ncbi:GlyGly-CTERM sorting domain-containing protein [Photobacterium frigidiphilum]|uniref:GlyGly-CTERM sorting domain-containing protein n=1 Tax=Photobacterium frigidiphilum TaxID=264736 RepID=A0A2T3JH76_9GAMM|nr:DUF3466 family protein [Photobacterium frigidiphilum]PSU48309.1 GlyGly-CTERM sorting domain-containing protein [Photobacterium frigidiphilum]
MQHKMLKLSTLAMLIASATSANAAVYKVVEVPADSAVGSQDYYGMNTADTFEIYGQGITQSSSSDNCFDPSGTCNSSNYTVFGESRLGTDGVSYRDEIPYLTDNYQHAIDYNGIYRYCIDNLGFNTCDVWAETQYYGKGFNRDDIKDRTGFGGLQREQAAWSRSYSANAYPLVDGSIIDTFATSQTPIADAGLGAQVVNSSNAVVNGIVDDIPFGNASSSFFANSAGKYVRQFDKRGFVKAPAANVELLPAIATTGSATEKALVTKMGQTVAWDAVEYPANSGQLLIVGSGSFAPSNLDDSDKLPDTDDVDIGVGVSSSTLSKCASEYSATSKTLFDTYECQFSVFANDAMLWSLDSSSTSSVPQNGQFIAKTSLNPEDPDNEDRSAQASARAVEVVKKGEAAGKPVAVGYSTVYQDNDYYVLRATIYTPDTSEITGKWSTKFIPGTEVENNDGDRQFSYSTGTDINSNNKVIGIAKNYRAENRSYAQKMFVFDNVTGTTKFLDTSIDSTIFFDGSNGYTAAINNHDVVVGWVDSETVNQVDGRERRQRAFLFNDGATIANSPLSANGAWMLDTLTNDNGDKSAISNQFRIAQATGINDAGVISATALRCAGGYDNLTSESQCSGDERLVAVKLVPIVDGTIQARPKDSGTIERSGASFGMFALTLLGLFGFRRRK